MKLKFFSLGLLALLGLDARAKPAHVLRDQAYLSAEEASQADAYRKESTKLDVYIPADAHNCPIVVWFHSGGLVNGSKFIPGELTNRGFIIVAPNYRLTPKGKAVNTLEDSAAATAWVFKNAESLGGSRSRIFMSGASAGGFISAMLTLDKHWLRGYGIDSNQIAGLITFSGQMITHVAFRAEHAIGPKQPVIDAYAPLYHVRADTPPFLMITGDRELELLGRYDENAYMTRMMKIVGHTQTRLIEIPGKDHPSMTPAAFPYLLAEIERVLGTSRP